MTLDAAYVKKIVDETGFDAANLEKVVRLRQLLIEFHKHPFLAGRTKLTLAGCKGCAASECAEAEE
jgi:hypothetical protein